MNQQAYKLSKHPAFQVFIGEVSWWSSKEEC